MPWSWIEKTNTNLKSSLRIWMNVCAAMSEPESIQSMFRGVSVIPELMIRATSAQMSLWRDAQEKWLNGCRSLEQTLQAVPVNRVANRRKDH